MDEKTVNASGTPLSGRVVALRQYGFGRWIGVTTLLRLLVVVLIVGLVWGPIAPPSAIATIRKIEEAPGQMVIQARRTLRDSRGSSWQTIAFKRQRPDGTNTFYLRLVGFPGTAEFERSQPLLLTNSLGQSVTAEDVSDKIFTNPVQPEPHVGQYDLQPFIDQLQPELPLRLTLPTLGETPIELNVPPSLVNEWQSVSTELFAEPTETASPQRQASPMTGHCAEGMEHCGPHQGAMGGRGRGGLLNS